EQAVERGFQLGGVHALARSVADVQNDIRDRGIVEGRVVLWQLQLPGALCARSLERQETLVAQVGLEHPTLVACPAGDNGLYCTDIVRKAFVLRTLPHIVIASYWRLAQTAL